MTDLGGFFYFFKKEEKTKRTSGKMKGKSPS